MQEPARAAGADSILAANLADFARNRLALGAALVVVAFALMAALAPWIAPQDPYASDLFRRLQPPAWMDGGTKSWPRVCILTTGAILAVSP